MYNAKTLANNALILERRSLVTQTQESEALCENLQTLASRQETFILCLRYWILMTSLSESCQVVVFTFCFQDYGARFKWTIFKLSYVLMPYIVNYSVKEILLWPCFESDSTGFKICILFVWIKSPLSVFTTIAVVYNCLQRAFRELLRKKILASSEYQNFTVNSCQWTLCAHCAVLTWMASRCNCSLLQGYIVLAHLNSLCYFITA